jgi:hypothetical protein
MLESVSSDTEVVLFGFDRMKNLPHKSVNLHGREYLSNPGCFGKGTRSYRETKTQPLSKNVSKI